MGKVDWITWETDVKDIINPDKIEEKITDYYLNYNTYMTPVVYEQLKHEMINGGLSLEAFNVGGISPATLMAKKIISKIIEIDDMVDELKQNVYDALSEQKRVEKEQLVDSIEAMIKKETIVKSNIENNYDIQKQIISMGENPQDVLLVVNDKLKKLNERLALAKEL